MALIPKTKYPGQVDDSDPTYPQGKAQNVSSTGAGDGTPWEKDLVNDFWGFLQALLDTASITPSGSPDKVGTSQYLQAVQAIASAAVAALSSALATAITTVALTVTGQSTLADVLVKGVISFDTNGRLKFKGTVGADADATFDFRQANIIYAASNISATRTYTLTMDNVQPGDWVIVVNAKNQNLNVVFGPSTETIVGVADSTLPGVLILHSTATGVFKRVFKYTN